MTPQETLKDIANELRSHPGHWTQGAGARDVKGDKVSVSSKSAVCWCLWGHVYRRVPDNALNVTLLLDKTLGYRDHVEWNDVPGREVEDVIKLCEKAAAL